MSDPSSGAARDDVADGPAVDARPRPVVPVDVLTSRPAQDAGRVLGELAIAAAGIGTFDIDLVTGTVTWDDVVGEAIGMRGDGGDQTVETFAARVHPDDRARVAQAMADVVVSGEEYDEEYRMVLPSGEVRWMAARGRVLHDADGTPARLLGAAYDITERRASEARLAEVLESMPTAFFSLGPDWRFTYVNAEAERVLGRPREELVGGDVWELFPAALGSEFEESYRGAVRTGRPALFEAYYPEPLDAWFEVRAWPGPDGLAVYFLDISARRRAQEEAQRSEHRAALIARVTAELSETLDAEQAVGRLAQLVVPELADWCIVTLVDDAEQAGARRGLRDIGWWHVDPRLRPVVERYTGERMRALSEGSFLHQALATGRRVSVTDHAVTHIHAMLRPGPARDLVLQLAPETATVLPLRGRAGTVGLMTLFGGAARAPLGPEELATADEVAARAGLTLDNSRLYRQQRQLAEGLQRALLTEPPRVPGLRIAVRYEPAAEAAEVGGDWYDAFLHRDGRAAVVIGDVVGHDIVAAASMGQLRSLVRGIAVATGAGPAGLLEDVDHAMLTLRAGTLATAVVATVDPPAADAASASRSVRWSNAGHPPPVVLGPDGSVTEIAATGPDLMLGVAPETRRGETLTVLGPGATMFLYTDGLVERREEPLGDSIATLHAVLGDLAGRDLDELCDEVLRRMLPAVRTDDVAVVAVRLEPALDTGADATGASGTR